MTKELEGKVAVVTGGTSGIGRDAAVLFAKSGANVVIAGRREPEGNETVEMIRAAGGDGLFVKTDVSKAAEVEALIQKAVEKFGRLDIAFNNAGIEGVWAPIVRQIRRRLGSNHRHQSQGRLALPEVRDSADAQAGSWRGNCKYGIDYRAGRFCWGGRL